ncbi:MAG: hypothetical protein IAE98_12705 [Candidatus Kapabacteria bacterium]|nr:hypothetical protein [Candidatus Kapabacteria bacterium]
MKKFHILIFGVIFFMATSLTQALPEIFYTNFARTTGGGLVLNSNVDVRITIFDGATEVYKETHAGITTDEFGLFTVPVGGGAPVIPFNNAMYDALIASNNLNIYAESDAGDGYRFIELRSLLNTALRNAEVQGIVTLQSAYDAGNEIEVVVGFPVDLTGTGLIQSAASVADINTNGPSTLTTKQYVDDAIAAIFPLPHITEGDAIEILPDGYYDGQTTQSIGVADNTISNVKIHDNTEFQEVEALGDGFADGTDVGSWSVTNSNRVLNFAGVGLTNVTRDGNTILIDGSDNWGLQVVESDATLIGDGTIGNELGVNQDFPFVWTSYHQFIPDTDEPAIALDGSSSLTNPTLIAVGNADPAVVDFMFDGEMVLLGTDDTDANAELTVYGSTQMLGQKNDAQPELYVEGDVAVTGSVDAERGFFTFDNTGNAGAFTIMANATGDTPSSPTFPTVAQAVTAIATYSGVAPNMTDMLVANNGLTNAGAGILAVGTYGGSRSANLVANVGTVGHAYNSLSPYNSHGIVGMVTTTLSGATEIGTALGLGINSGITGINLGVAANDYAGYFIGNVNVDGDFNGTGNAVFEMDVNVQGNADVDGDLNADGATTLGGTLDVADNAVFAMDVNVQGNADVDGDLNADGATTLGGTLDVADNAVFAMDVNVQGNADVDGDLNADGATTLGGTLDVADNAVFAMDVNVQGNADVDGDLNADGATTLGGTLDVADNADFAMDVQIDGILNVDGTSNLNGDVNLGDVSTDNVVFNAMVNSAVVPSMDNTYSLGTDANRWADVYVGPASLNIGTSGNNAVISYDLGNNWVDINTDLNVQGTVYGTTLNGAYTEGSVLFGAADGSITENNGELFWDDASSYLGIGTDAPASKLHLLAPSDVALIIEGTQGDSNPDVLIDGEVLILGSVNGEAEFWMNGGDGMLLDGGASLHITNGDGILLDAGASMIIDDLGTLNVDGDGTFNNDLYVSNDLFVTNDGDFGNDVIVGNDLSVTGLATFENVMVNEFAESAKTGAEIAAEASDDLFVTKDYVQGGHFGSFNTLIAFNPASGPAITATSSDATAPTVTIENTHPDGTALQVQSNNASTTAFEIPTGNMSIGNGQLIVSANAGITSTPPEGQGPALIVGNFGTSGENGGAIFVTEGHTALSFSSFDETTTDYSEVTSTVIDINAGAAMVITDLPGTNVSADMPGTLLYIINSGTFTITLPDASTIPAGTVATFVNNGSAWFRIN